MMTSQYNFPRLVSRLAMIALLLVVALAGVSWLFVYCSSVQAAVQDTRPAAAPLDALPAQETGFSMPQLTATINLPGIGRDPTRMAVNPVTNYIYVTNQGSDNVTVVSGTQILAVLPAGDSPYGVDVDPATGYVYVTNFSSSDVTILSGTEVVTSVPVGGTPTEVRVNPDNGLVYVANSQYSTISILKGTEVISTVEILYPSDFAINPVADLVYVMQDGGVTVLSETTVISNLDVITRPQQIAVNPVTGYGYIFGGMPNALEIAVISGTEVVTHVPISEPWCDSGAGFVREAIGINPQTGYVYIPCPSFQRVFVFSETQLISTVHVLVEGSRVGVDSTSGYVYIPDYADGRMTILTGTQVITTVDNLGDGWNTDIEVNPNTGLVYILESTCDTVSVFSGLDKIAALTSGIRPSGIVVNPATGYVYVTDHAYPDGAVWILSGTQVIAYRPIGLFPESPVINPKNGYVYIPLTGADSVAVLSGTEIITHVMVEEYPRSIGVNPLTGYVYVGSMGLDNRGYMTVLTGTDIITSYIVGMLPTRIAAAPSSELVYLLRQSWDYMSGPGDVVIISNTEVISKIMMYSPSDVASDPTTGYVYVTDASEGGSLFVLSDTQIITRIPFHLSSAAGTSASYSTYFLQTLPIAVDPGAGNVYVLNAYGGMVDIVSGFEVVAQVLMDAVGTQEFNFNMDVNPVIHHAYIISFVHNSLVTLHGARPVWTTAVGLGPQVIGVNPATGLIYVGNKTGQSISILEEKPGYEAFLPVMLQR
jgi:DNA-binding beta-propeller fold protein YncE